jgi:hypothetical protein
MASCLVSAKDYREHWKGEKAPSVKPAPKYSGPERRQNAHDRRWFAGQGGRRVLDRKS